METPPNRAAHGRTQTTTDNDNNNNNKADTLPLPSH